MARPIWPQFVPAIEGSMHESNDLRGAHTAPDQQKQFIVYRNWCTMLLLWPHHDLGLQMFKYFRISLAVAPTRP